LPQELAPVIGSFGDKTHHILAFVILGILLRFAYEMKYIYAFLFLLTYGIFIEISQLFTINRSAEIMDVVADLIGAVIGITFYTYLKKIT
jgi:VanZ family protein